MKNQEGQLMTREEANAHLQQALMQLAQHAVMNSRLSKYIDQVEIYLSELDAKDAKEKAEKEAAAAVTEEAPVKVEEAVNE